MLLPEFLACKPYVGQPVVQVSKHSYGKKYKPVVTQTKVAKVGRKYFTLECNTSRQFRIDNKREHTEYSSGIYLYPSIEVYEEVLLQKKMAEKIIKSLSGVGGYGFNMVSHLQQLSVSALEDIAVMLDETELLSENGFEIPAPTHKVIRVAGTDSPWCLQVNTDDKPTMFCQGFQNGGFVARDDSDSTVNTEFEVKEVQAGVTCEKCLKGIKYFKHLRL